MTIWYFYDGAPGDVDNIVKPIHDALVGLACIDDMQVTDSVVRRRDFRVAMANIIGAAVFPAARRRAAG